MFNEKSITPGLAELGYLRLKRLTYKASWSSTDVEHFLFFFLFSGGYYFACHFGIRNLAAERFAIGCLKSFGGPLFQTMRFDPRFGCHMRFSLGGLAGWGPRWSLKPSDMSEAALADKVKCDVRDLVLPAIRSVLSPAALFSLLIEDAEPCRWLGVSGAIRAAMIVYLGRRMGMQTSELDVTLQPYSKHITGSLGGRAESFSFLERVLHYSS